MNKLVKLFEVTGKPEYRSSENMLKSIQEIFASGEVEPDDKMMFVYMRNNNLRIGFLQKGMDAMNMLAMLEVAKMQVYKQHIEQLD